MPPGAGVAAVTAGRAGGSAVVLDDRALVTNAHVLGATMPVTVLRGVAVVDVLAVPIELADHLPSIRGRSPDLRPRSDAGGVGARGWSRA